MLSHMQFQHRWWSSISRLLRFDVSPDGWARIPRPRRFAALVFYFIQRYLCSLNSLFALGLFNAAAVALISHKTIFISLHHPISVWKLVFLWPCLFEFDILTLILLHWGLSSRKKACMLGAGVVCLVTMLLSSCFAAFYIQARAEVEWKTAVEVRTP